MSVFPGMGDKAKKSIIISTFETVKRAKLEYVGGPDTQGVALAIISSRGIGDGESIIKNLTFLKARMAILQDNLHPS
jgi:hypothetical protein